MSGWFFLLLITGVLTLFSGMVFFSYTIHNNGNLLNLSSNRLLWQQRIVWIALSILGAVLLVLAWVEADNGFAKALVIGFSAVGAVAGIFSIIGAKAKVS